LRNPVLKRELDLKKKRIHRELGLRKNKSLNLVTRRTVDLKLFILYFPTLFFFIMPVGLAKETSFIVNQQEFIEPYKLYRTMSHGVGDVEEYILY
jgi:hypothetical protein